MLNSQVSTFNDLDVSQISAMAQEAKNNNYSFVQMCVSTLDEGCELLYSFSNPESSVVGLIGYRCVVKDGAHVPSITNLFPAAFVFENEAHDLFGINVDGISIDFEGDFYQVAVAYPMNPRVDQNEEGNNE